MAELIDRQAAIDSISKGCQELRGVFARCEENIEALPSVELVQCKDCKHNPKVDILDEICTFVNPPKDDFFCKYGERRDDE